MWSMPREGKTAITVNSNTHTRLKDSKPDGLTWDQYLLQQCGVVSEYDTNDNDRSNHFPIFTTSVRGHAFMEGVMVNSNTFEPVEKDLSFSWVDEHDGFNWPIINFRFEKDEQVIEFEMSFADARHMASFGELLIAEANNTGYGEIPEEEDE